MVAREHPAIAVRPAVSVVQLDTHFPRIAGDVGAPESYAGEIEILRVPRATVARVVSGRPDLIDIAPFEAAVARARGQVIVTSCGFLSYWQQHLSAFCEVPFISSSLTALDGLAEVFTPAEVMVVTFDADSLTAAHLGANPDFLKSVVGLPKDAHLRKVIAGDEATLDRDRAQTEVAAVVQKALGPEHRHILLECTNFPPYAQALRTATGLPVSHILTCIEKRQAGAVRPPYLTHQQA